MSNDARWPFLRDVLVFQVKLVLGNLQNFLLVPVSLIAALLDLFRGGAARQGERFYQVLELGRQIDEGINLYSAIGGYHSTAAASSEETQAPEAETAPVDLVVRRVEDVILREYRKGGSAASLKAAVDRVLDQMQRESRAKGSGKDS